MKYFFDTEFIEDGRTIDLVSIGIASEDGRAYYAESSEFDESKANEWVRANVLAKLGPPASRKPRATIADEIVAFVGDNPEFWAYYGAYDWVCLCQLFGTMMDLPKGWPMFCRDLKQRQSDAGATLPPQPPGDEHHALNDAAWTRTAFLSISA